MGEIDPAWLQHQVSVISGHLIRQYPAVPATSVERVVHRAAAELAVVTCSPNHLSLLIHRRAHARLRAIHTGVLIPLQRHRGSAPFA